MAPGQRIAWFDGEILPVDAVRVSPLSHSLHYGTAVFEGIRCYAQEGGGRAVFRLVEHMERLHQSARILGVKLPYTCEQLCEAALETMRRSGLEEGYLRPIAWLGEGAMGVAGGQNPVHTLIAVWAWGAYLGEEGIRNGIRTIVCAYERAAANASAPRAKISGQYTTAFMAKRQVNALGLEEGLLLDRDGYLAEGTGENLFVVRKGELITPPDSSPILLGLTRDAVVQLAGDMGIPVRFERFTRTALYAADEAFLTGTAAEITPIREVDGRALRSSPGPLTKALQAAFFDLVRGRGSRSAGWLSQVDVAVGEAGVAPASR